MKGSLFFSGLLFAFSAATKPKIIIHPEEHNDFAYEQRRKSIMDPNVFTLLEFSDHFVQNSFGKYYNQSFGFEDHDAKLKMALPTLYLRHVAIASENETKSQKQEIKMLMQIMQFLNFCHEYDMIPTLRHVSESEMTKVIKRFVRYDESKIQAWDGITPPYAMTLFSRDLTNVMDEICMDIQNYYYRQSIKVSFAQRKVLPFKFAEVYDVNTKNWTEERDVFNAKNIVKFYDLNWRKKNDRFPCVCGKRTFHIIVAEIGQRNKGIGTCKRCVCQKAFETNEFKTCVQTT